MRLPKFSYHQPAGLDEACLLYRQFGSQGALLAGGTDLLVKMKERLLKPEHIISLDQLDELKTLSLVEDEVILGSCCSLADIAESELIRSLFPAIAHAAREIGAPSVRNMGTVGGNIVTASPAADLPPALIAHDAKVRLKDCVRDRAISLENVFAGPGRTHIGQEEILVDIRLTKPVQHTGAGFFKVGTRNALQISIINGACRLTLDPATGCITAARVVLGAVAPTVIRASSAENVLSGQFPQKSLFQKAGKAAAEDCKPIDDLRGSAEYRREMVAVWTARTLETALEQARNSSGSD